MLERLLTLFDRYPLDYIAAAAGSLPIIIGLIRYVYLTRPLRVSLLFFLMHFAGDVYSVWLAIQYKNNLFMLNLYPIVGTLVLSLVYYLLIKTDRIRYFIMGAGVILLVFCLLQFEPLTVSYAESAIYEIYVTALALLYFSTLLTDLRVKNILLHSMFWISASLLVYMTGTFFIFLFNQFIFDPKLVDDEQFTKYWNLHNVLYCLMTVLAAIGLWVSKYDQNNVV